MERPARRGEVSSHDAGPRRRVAGLLLFLAGVAVAVLVRGIGEEPAAGWLAAGLGGLLMGAGAVLVLGRPEGGSRCDAQARWSRSCDDTV